MKVSKQFLRDFALIANHYRWTPADIEEIKADTRANPETDRSACKEQAGNRVSQLVKYLMNHWLAG